MVYGIVKSFRKFDLYRERRLAGMVAERWSWMLDGVRCGRGSKSSGAWHVLSAPVKYWRGQNTRSCWSS